MSRKKSFRQAGLLLGLMLALITQVLARENPAYELLARYPHPGPAFTQGLEMHEGMLLESSGLYGRSYIARGPVGETPHARRLPANVFAEGLTVLNERLYLLSWRNQRGFILNPRTLELQREFRYRGEGWGLANDGRHLIMSNGSSYLQFIDPEDFRVVRRVRVTHNGNPLTWINELEYHNGLLLANHWKQDHLLVIDPESGNVVQKIDVSDLYPPSERAPGTDVLNGIAYDPETDTWLVTGKLWPEIYRLRLDLPYPDPP